MTIRELINEEQDWIDMKVTSQGKVLYAVSIDTIYDYGNEILDLNVKSSNVTSDLIMSPEISYLGSYPAASLNTLNIEVE